MERPRPKNKFNFGDTLYHPVFSDEGYFQLIKGPLELESIRLVKHYNPMHAPLDPPRYVEFVYEFGNNEYIKETELYTSREAAEKAVLVISQKRMDNIQRSVKELLKK